MAKIDRYTKKALEIAQRASLTSAIEGGIVALAGKLEESGIDPVKVCDCAQTFDESIHNLIPDNASAVDIAMTHLIANMMSMDLNIGASEMSFGKHFNPALRFCYLHYRKMCEDRGLLDENGKLKE